MTNTSRPVGFKPKNIKNASTRNYAVTAAQVLTVGDVVSFDSAGTLVIGAGSPIAGVVAAAMIDPVTGGVKATAEAGDFVAVWDDPNEVFVGQESTFAATDPYTTASSAACFDIAGNTGVQYIDAGSSSQDAVKVLALEWEENGKKSIAGASAKVSFQFNGLKHFRGTTA